MGIEIEKKFTVKKLPEDIDSFPYHVIEQAYLNVHPAIRVRREDDIFYMTYKGAHSDKEGEIGQVEYNMPLDEESYRRLASKAEGVLIKKKRYLIPLNEDAFEREYLLSHPDLTEGIKSGEVKKWMCLMILMTEWSSQRWSFPMKRVLQSLCRYRGLTKR